MYFAAHSATASDRRARLHKVVAWPLIALMIWQPTLALAEVVPVAPDGYRPTLDSAANGIDVMNIANPDANVLSHNLYNRFDEIGRASCRERVSRETRGGPPRAATACYT